MACWSLPYTVSDFVELLSRPDSITLLAWDQDKQGNPRLVGYLIAERYNLGEIPDDERTTMDGFLAPAPREGDLIFDTFAVSRQGEKIGTTLIDLMLTQSLSDPDYDTSTLYTFAVDPKSVRKEALREGAYPYTRDMLNKHPGLSVEWEYHIPDYRGAAAYYMKVGIT